MTQASLTRFAGLEGLNSINAGRSLAVKEEGGRGTPVVDQDAQAILEYMLPMEGGRRKPDMIVIENGCVLILEFKGLEL